MKISRFSDLTVWQRAHELTLATYRVTDKFPRSEQFGVVTQVRRAAASISANIAEGFGRRTTRELGYINATQFGEMNSLRDSVGQLINALGRSLKGKIETSRV